MTLVCGTHMKLFDCFLRKKNLDRGNFSDFGMSFWYSSEVICDEYGRITI